MKEPSANAFAAYRAVILTSMKQEDVGRRFGVEQSTISRWVRDVGKWIRLETFSPMTSCPAPTTEDDHVGPEEIGAGTTTPWPCIRIPICMP